jgi:hypothetical protein
MLKCMRIREKGFIQAINIPIFSKNYPIILTPEIKGAHAAGLDLMKLNNTPHESCMTASRLTLDSPANISPSLARMVQVGL